MYVKQYYSSTGADEKRTTKECHNPITNIRYINMRYINVMSIGGFRAKENFENTRKLKSMKVYVRGSKTRIESRQCCQLTTN